MDPDVLKLITDCWQDNSKLRPTYKQIIPAVAQKIHVLRRDDLTQKMTRASRRGSRMSRVSSFAPSSASTKGMRKNERPGSDYFFSNEQQNEKEKGKGKEKERHPKEVTFAESPEFYTGEKQKREKMEMKNELNSGRGMTLLELARKSKEEANDDDDDDDSEEEYTDAIVAGLSAEEKEEQLQDVTTRQELDLLARSLAGREHSWVSK